MADSSHEYIPATETDSRSPCPALNALANHGYLPRDGKNLTATQLISAITSVYKFSYPFATILSLGGIALDGHGLSLDLDGLRPHNVIEHDASIAHRDLDETGGTLPTNKPDAALIQEIIDSSDGHKVTLENLIKFKAKREDRANVAKAYPKTILQRFSHGELIILTEAFQSGGGGGGGGDGGDDGPSIPVEWFKAFLLEERLPEGLNPPHTIGIISVDRKTREVARRLAALHAEAAKDQPAA